MSTGNSYLWSWNYNNSTAIGKSYAIIVNGGFDIKPTLVKSVKVKKEKILNKEVSKNFAYFEKIVTTKEGTASLANVNGYEIGGKTGTAQKSISGGYSRQKINTFVSVFPTSKPKFVMAIMIDEPKISKDYIYN